MQLDSNDVQRLSGNNVFMMPGNYFNFWNFTPFMGSNIPSLPIMAPFIPQKWFDSGLPCQPMILYLFNLEIYQFSIDFSYFCKGLSFLIYHFQNTAMIKKSWKTTKTFNNSKSGYHLSFKINYRALRIFLIKNYCNFICMM